MKPVYLLEENDKPVDGDLMYDPDSGIFEETYFTDNELFNKANYHPIIREIPDYPCIGMLADEIEGYFKGWNINRELKEKALSWAKKIRKLQI